MYKLCLFSLVLVAVISAGQDGSSNQQILFGDGVLSHQTADGTVHSIGSIDSNSFMSSKKPSKRSVKSMGTDEFGNSFMSNHPKSHVDDFDQDIVEPDFRNIDFSDLFESDTEQEIRKNSDEVTTEQQTTTVKPLTTQESIVDTPKIHKVHRVPRVRPMVVVAGGNGADAADAPKHGADGPDGPDAVPAHH